VALAQELGLFFTRDVMVKNQFYLVLVGKPI